MNNVHFAIPEIYGDSLSYYEVLRELIEAMNVMIDNYDTIPEQIADAVENLDIFNQLIDSIATDNTKSTKAVNGYKKHDLLYATFNESVNLYESLIDFTTGTELSIGTNIREVNISELFIEIRKLIENEAQARKQADNELRELIRESSGGVTEAQLNEEITNRQNADNTLQTNIDNVNERFGNIKFVYQSNVQVHFPNKRISDVLTPPEHALAILSINGGPKDFGWTYTFYDNQFKILCTDNIVFDNSFNMNIVWACSQ